MNLRRSERSRRLRVHIILERMRADDVPAGLSGLWEVRKVVSEKPWGSDRGRLRPPGRYTALLRTTGANLHGSPETVMSDDPIELSRHLEFVMQARGRVLVTGLGLGCVVRGLDWAGGVSTIDIVERDRHVIDLVGKYVQGPGITIHHADAFDFVRSSETTWDYAWHDLWSDPDRGEEHLPVVHQRLMLDLRKRVRWQGAWAFPKIQRRILERLYPKVRAWARP